MATAAAEAFAGIHYALIQPSLVHTKYPDCASANLCKQCVKQGIGELGGDACMWLVLSTTQATVEQAHWGLVWDSSPQDQSCRSC